MRVLHAVHGFFPEFHGGTERYVEALAVEEVRAGHDVRLLVGSGRAGEAPWIDLVRHRGRGAPELSVYRLHRIGIDIDLWTKSDAPHAEPLIRALLGRLRPDVLHVHHWLRLSRTLVRLAAGEGVPVVLTLHDLASTCPRGFRIHAAGHFCEEPMGPGLCPGCAPEYPWQDPGEIKLELVRFGEAMAAEVRAATRLLVPSRAHGELLGRLHGLEPERLLVVPPGDISSVKPFSGRRAPDPGGRLRLVHWGELRRDKGIHVLLDALHALPQGARDRVALTVHGDFIDDDYEAEIRRQAAGLPVTFTGPFAPSDLDGARHDLAILPTLCHESHSFVLDEAFRLRLPVLVSARGALVERAGDAALAFPPGDAGALARLIERVLEDPGELRRLEAAIPPALPSMKAHAGAILAIYAEAAEEGPPSGVRMPEPAPERLLRARAVETRDIRIIGLRAALDADAGDG